VPGLLDRKLLFVTGKGGTGKTTVAAALGLLAAAEGKRTLVCEMDAKGNMTDFYEVPPTTFEEREVVPGLWAMSMDTEASLRQYLTLQLKLPLVARVGPLAKMFDFVASAAPGVKEIVSVGKLCWEVREGHYDLVIADAPATGHVVSQLAAPQAINGLVQVGLVRQQTGWMLELLGDPATTGLAIVTTPAEMPVQETIELRQRVAAETNVDLAAVLVNRVMPELFGRGEEEVFERLCDDDAVTALDKALGGPSRPLLDGARLAVTLRRNRAKHLEHLRRELGAGVPTLYLPYLFLRSHGMRATRLIAEALGAEIGL
jgi:anion-transporting  ArsA/GET3 family ATPase